MIVRFILICIRIYQYTLSFDTGIIRFILPFQSSCRFYPRCSDYTYEAISQYGILKGVLLGIKRILRCHPWQKGGFDPVPTQHRV